MVLHPQDYRWSSARCHLGTSMDHRLRAHPVFLGLGRDRRLRGQVYAAWLMQPIGEDELNNIRRHLHKQRALGDERFQAMLERTLNRPIACREPGRPRRDQLRSTRPEDPPVPVPGHDA